MRNIISIPAVARVGNTLLGLGDCIHTDSGFKATLLSWSIDDSGRQSETIHQFGELTVDSVNRSMDIAISVHTPKEFLKSIADDFNKGLDKDVGEDIINVVIANLVNNYLYHFQQEFMRTGDKTLVMYYNADKIPMVYFCDRQGAEE